MSSDQTIYQYRLYCIEEATFVYTWSSTTPLSCPNDHTDRTIDTNQTVIVGKMSENRVIASQDTLKNFQHMCVPMNIPSMTPGTVYTQDFSWPMDIQIWKTEFYSTADHIGDTLNMIVAPNTVVGALTQAADIGATTIHVSPTAVTNQLISKGVYMNIINGLGQCNDGGRVIAYDTTANTITFETPLTTAYNPGAYVRLNVKVINNVLLHRTNSVYRIGEKGLRGRAIPANTVIRGTYTNVSGAAKQLVLVIEIYYE